MGSFQYLHVTVVTNLHFKCSPQFAEAKLPSWDFQERITSHVSIARDYPNSRNQPFRHNFPLMKVCALTRMIQLLQYHEQRGGEMIIQTVKWILEGMNSSDEAGPSVTGQAFIGTSLQCNSVEDFPWTSVGIEFEARTLGGPEGYLQNAVLHSSHVLPVIAVHRATVWRFLFEWSQPWTFLPLFCILHNHEFEQINIWKFFSFIHKKKNYNLCHLGVMAILCQKIVRSSSWKGHIFHRHKGATSSYANEWATSKWMSQVVLKGEYWYV